MADYRVIPAIEILRQRETVRAMEVRHGGDAVVRALRDGAGQLRAQIGAGDGPPDSEAAARVIEALAEAALASHARGSLRPVINATGVVIHTNLGRAPIAEAAIERVAAIAKGYSNLEYDVAGGERGSRTVHAESLLTSLTGAEAAIVVNNNAAATLLILTGLASGREVIISRGELVEIGGGFRVPDVMRQSGAVLREVGTTNRTRVNDYVAAVSTATAMFLRVHPSNFRIEGFTERPSLGDLIAAARSMKVPVVEDIGSGCLVDDSRRRSRSVQASIAAGVDLICFSGDKLLGGPQAGHHRRTQGAGRSVADASADARAARRQDHAGHPRSDAGRILRRPRRHHRARAADVAPVAGRDRRRAPGARRHARRRVAGAWR